MHNFCIDRDSGMENQGGSASDSKVKTTGKEKNVPTEGEKSSSMEEANLKGTFRISQFH